MIGNFLVVFPAIRDSPRYTKRFHSFVPKWLGFLSDRIRWYWNQYPSADRRTWNFRRCSFAACPRGLPRQVSDLTGEDAEKHSHMFL